MFNIDHLHPIIVHFPIALIITGFLFDVIYIFNKKEVCLSQTGFYLMIAGTITATFAFTTGYLSAVKITRSEIVPILHNHEIGAMTTLAIMGVACMLRIYLVNKNIRKPLLQMFMLGIYFIGVIALLYTGLAGGYMVYEFMVEI